LLYWTLSPISFGPTGILLLEKIYSVILFIAGLSLRDLSERLCLTCASREFGKDMGPQVLIVIQTIKES
jgi:hypothetical protein